MKSEIYMSHEQLGHVY